MSAVSDAAPLLERRYEASGGRLTFLRSTEKIVKKAEDIAQSTFSKVCSYMSQSLSQQTSIWISLFLHQTPLDLNAVPQSVRVRDALAKSIPHEHCQIQEIADRLRKAGF